MLAVLVQCRCANAVQFATRQHRLQHVGGIHCAFRGPSTDQRMQFVNKEDNRALGTRHFFQDRLQAFLKLTAILGSCD